MAKQYLYIYKSGSVTISDWCLFPDWETLLMIIDTINHQFITITDWPDEDQKQDWQEMQEDHL